MYQHFWSAQYRMMSPNKARHNGVPTRLRRREQVRIPSAGARVERVVTVRDEVTNGAELLGDRVDLGCGSARLVGTAERLHVEHRRSFVEGDDDPIWRASVLEHPV